MFIELYWKSVYSKQRFVSGLSILFRWFMYLLFCRCQTVLIPIALLLSYLGFCSYEKALWPKATRGRQIYFSLQLSGCTSSLQEVGAGIWGQNWKVSHGGTPLTVQFPMAYLVCHLILFRILDGPKVLSLQWAGPFDSNHLSRNCFTNLPLGQSNGGLLSIGVPLIKYL